MRTFSISSPPGEPITLSNGTGSIPFTVTNTTSTSATGTALIVPTPPTTLDWYAVSGDNTRTFPAAGVEQFTVTITAPPATPPGTYAFRFDAKSEANPEEDYTEGPTVQFKAPEPPKPVPWWKKYWWIIAIVAVVLIGIIIAIIVLSGDDDGEPAPTPTVTPTATAPPGDVSGLPERNCDRYDPGSVTTEPQGDGSLVVRAGGLQLALADNTRDAALIVQLAQAHSRHCQIGARAAEYWVGRGRGSNPPPIDCLPYNRNTVQIFEDAPNSFRLGDSPDRAMVTVQTREDADELLAVAKAFNTHCFIGRDNRRPNRRDFITDYWE